MKDLLIKCPAQQTWTRSHPKSLGEDICPLVPGDTSIHAGQDSENQLELQGSESAEAFLHVPPPSRDQGLLYWKKVANHE
jgi:hypothetical protein